MMKIFAILFFFNSLIFASENNIRTIVVKVPLSFGTAEFEIHAKRKNLAVAHLVEKILIEDSPKIMQYFEYIPRTRVQFMIDDLADSANGAATPFPENLIYLYNYPPTGDGHLATSDDWWRILVLHELTHILHLDQTRGFPNAVRTIFGSVGKWNGVAPRWFSEGIAVWAESEFTNSGRLRSAEVELELRRVVQVQNICTKLDCLDEPWAYPYGQLTYWMGGRFMQWLEKEKPRTIKCLVEANSDSIPFFINDAFIECTGKDAKLKFVEFIVAFREEIEKSHRDLPSHKIDMSNVGRVEWQNGRVQMGDKLFVSGYEATREEKDWLWEVDNKKGTTEKYRLPQYVERMMPGPGKLFLMLKRGLYFADKKNWAEWDIENKKLKKLNFSEDLEYLFSIDGKFFALMWNEGKWVLKKSDDDKKFTVWYTFPEFTVIRTPDLKKVGKELVLTFKSYDFKNYQLKQFIFAEEGQFVKSLNLYETPDPLIVVGECGGEYYSRANQSSEVAFISEKYFMDARFPAVVQEIEKCSDYDKWGLKKITTKDNEVKVTEMEVTGNADIFYPRPAHFLPHWWMAGVGIGGRYSHYKAETSLGDPRGDHTFYLSDTYYTKLEEHSPHLSYTNHQDLATNLDLYTTAAYSKDYYRSSLANFNESNETVLGSVMLTQRVQQFLNYPTLFVQKQNREDYFSKREQLVYGLQESLLVLPDKKDDVIGPIEWFGQYAQYDLDRYPDYKNFQTKLKLKLVHNWKSNLKLQGSYGKNYKSDYSSGVMYAGGGAQGPEGGNTLHEFFGIQYADAYGDEIVTTRAQYSYLINRRYEMYHLLFILPFYLKDVSLFGGYETLHAGQIFINNRSLGRRNIESVHGGIRLSATFGYFIPVNVEVIMARLLGSESSSTLVLQILGGGF